MGLLDNIYEWTSDPRNAQGLAAFGRALAQAGAPSRVGPTWGGGLSDAIAGFQDGRKGYDDQQLAKQMRDMQMRKMQSEALENEAQAQQRKQQADRAIAFQKLMGSNTAMALGSQQGDIGPTNSNAARIPQDPLAELRGKAQMAMGGGYAKEGGDMLEQANKITPKRDVREINGQLVEVPQQGSPSAIFGKPKLPDYLTYGPDGQPIVNQLVLSAKKQIAEAGRTQSEKFQYDATRGGLVNLKTGEFKPATQDGKPIETKASREAAKDDARRKSIIEGADNLLVTIKEAKELVNPTTSGLGGVTKYVPGGPGKTLESRLMTIKANLGFDRLQQMRQESPTGGALGQVAVQELMALQSTIASLDQFQGSPALKGELDKVEKHYKRWVDIMKEAGKGGGAANSDPLGLR